MRRALLGSALLAILAAQAGTGAVRSPAPARNGRIVFVARSPAEGPPPFPVSRLLSVPAQGGRVRGVGPVGVGKPWLSPDGRWILFGGDAGLWIMRADGTGARRLVLFGLTGSWAPDSRTIAFIRRDETLGTIRPDGSGLRVLFHRPETSIDAATPSWSPDGRRVAFVAVPTPEVPLRFPPIRIETVDVRTGAVTPVATDDRDTGDERTTIDLSPAWSPDGRWIALARTRSYPVAFMLGLVPARGGRFRPLLRIRTTPEWPVWAGPVWAPNSRRLALSDRRGTVVVSLAHQRATVVMGSALPQASPAWSPNGRLLAIPASIGRPPQDDLFVVGRDGRGRRRLSTLPLDTRISYSPVWSHDGRRVLFSVQAGRAPGPTSLRTILPGGGGDRVVPGSGTRQMVEPAWSPDGRLIAVAGNFGDRGFTVGILRPQAGRLTAFGRGESPAWSPDGRRLVFERDGGLYVRSLASGRERRLPLPRGRYSEPAWSPDGRLVAFIARHDYGSTVDVVRLDGTGRRAVVGEPSSCPRARVAGHPSWSPDARRLVFAEWDDPMCATAQKLYVPSLVVVRSDGTGRRILLDGRTFVPSTLPDYGTTYGPMEPAWSPDGREIAFTIVRGPQHETVAVVGTDGRGLRELAEGASPSWQPVR